MRLFVLLAAVVLGGCSVADQAPRLAPLRLPVNYTETTGSVSRSGDARWWSAFRDPVLDRIIESGLANNLDIRTAILRIDAAQSNIDVAGSGGLPSINFDASQIKSRETGEFKEVAGVVDTSTYGMSAAWLIDVFGEVRSQVRSAKASRNAAVEAVLVARLVLLSDIAAAYADARYYQELGAIGARALASREHTLTLTQQLERQGVVADLDVSRAQEAVDTVRGDLPDYDANYRRSANRISTLMGTPAGSILPALERRQGQPYPSFDPALGVPADLVRNRPDIRKAEQELAAAVADIGYARAQLYPTITLSGTITSSYISTNLKSGDLNKWSFGPSLRIPIFEGGRLRANVKIAMSTARQKELAWRAAVLKAVEEVENALVAYNRGRVAVGSLQSRVKASEKTARLSTAAYEAGMTSQLEALDAERQMFDARSSLALARRNLARNFIALNIAVGRGLPGPGQAYAPSAPAERQLDAEATSSIPPSGLGGRAPQ